MINVPKLLELAVEVAHGLRLLVKIGLFAPSDVLIVLGAHFLRNRLEHLLHQVSWSSDHGLSFQDSLWVFFDLFTIKLGVF